MPTEDNRYGQPSICPECREADLTEAECMAGACKGQCTECDAVVDSIGKALA